MIKAFAPRSDVVLLCRAPFAAQVFNLVRQVAPMVRITVSCHRSAFPAQSSAARGPRSTRAEHEQIPPERCGRSSWLCLPKPMRQSSSVRTSTNCCRSFCRKRRSTGFQSCATPRRDRAGFPCWHAAKLNWRHGVLFVGSYSHPPNVDAVRWLVREVWPLLQPRNFPHHLVIAGSDMPEEIATLASDTIDVRGYVEDLTALFTACRLSVAPLRWGAGIVRARSSQA